LAQKQINKINKQTNKQTRGEDVEDATTPRKAKTKTSQVPKHIMSIMGVLRGGGLLGVTLPLCQATCPRLPPSMDMPSAKELFVLVSLC